MSDAAAAATLMELNKTVKGLNERLEIVALELRGINELGTQLMDILERALDDGR